MDEQQQQQQQPSASHSPDINTNPPGDAPAGSQVVSDKSTKKKRKASEAAADHSSDDDAPVKEARLETAEIEEKLTVRKEKKSAREKARRVEENEKFKELAILCKVPPEYRDKSSILRAVIAKVVEVKQKLKISSSSSAQPQLPPIPQQQLNPPALWLPSGHHPAPQPSDLMLNNPAMQFPPHPNFHPNMLQFNPNFPPHMMGKFR